jgi:predicted  nucleic acid-binding Zn-ribbon protein
MTEVLVQLLKLQDLDREIRRREKRLEAIPNEIEHLGKCLEAERAKETSAKEQVRQSTLRRRESEGKIEDLEAKLRKYQTQLLGVKTNEEYTALLHEIAAVKDTIRAAEEEVLALMEAIESCQRDVSGAEKTVGEAREKHEREKSALEEERILATEERDALKARRETLVGEITNGVLKRYERVRAAIPENPVVEVTEGGACGGCFAQITLQRQSEIRTSGDLMSCENCGRIVYSKSS